MKTSKSVTNVKEKLGRLGVFFSDVFFSLNFDPDPWGVKKNLTIMFLRWVVQPPTTWRIIPLSKWLITMVSKSPNWGCSPYKWPKWLLDWGY